jgi:hypothetical protein
MVARPSLPLDEHTGAERAAVAQPMTSEEENCR